jgi:hypothetical protein
MFVFPDGKAGTPKKTVRCEHIAVRDNNESLFLIVGLPSKDDPNTLSMLEFQIHGTVARQLVADFVAMTQREKKPRWLISH